MTAREGENMMAATRQKRLQVSKKSYKSPNIITLPAPSELLLAQSLAKLAEAMVHNIEFRKRIVTAMTTIQSLLVKYPSVVMGSFSKSLVRLRTAIKTLPTEDVDPEYYSIMEDNLMDKFEALQARIIEALAWERRSIARNMAPTAGTADVKVIADRDSGIMTILISEHKTNLECMFQDLIEFRKKMKAAIDSINGIELPEPMKISIRKSLHQIIYCISLEASIPYKLKNHVEDFLEMLLQPHPLTSELKDMVKLLKVKSENCLADSKRQHHYRMKALRHIECSLEELDTVLAETKRPYWMMDMPDVFDHRKRAFKTELSAYTEILKKKYNIIAQEEHLGCVCYRTRKDRKSAREVPLCTELLQYTEEVRKRMNIQPFRKDGKCYCSWLYSSSADCSAHGTESSLSLRQYTTSIKARAVARDVVKDVTCCYCYWMKLQRVFGGMHRDTCFSMEDVNA